MTVDAFQTRKRNITILPPSSQRAWGWPVVANFILGGAGAGTYLVSFIKGIMQGEYFGLSKHFSASILGPVLAVLGFIALALEAGQPLKSIHLVRGTQYSWLSRETVFWGIFVFFAVLDWFIPGPFVRIASVLAAFTLMMSQGFILFQMRAIIAWNIPVVPVFFISSGFVSGFGVLLLTGGPGGSLFSMNFVFLIAITMIANLLVWFLYLCRYRAADIEECDREEGRFMHAALPLMGHVIPLTVLLMLAARGYRGSVWPFYIEAASGLVMLLCVIYQKKIIVLDNARFKKITVSLFDS